MPGQIIHHCPEALPARVEPARLCPGQGTVTGVCCCPCLLDCARREGLLDLCQPTVVRGLLGVSLHCPRHAARGREEAQGDQAEDAQGEGAHRRCVALLNWLKTAPSHGVALTGPGRAPRRSRRVRRRPRRQRCDTLFLRSAERAVRSSLRSALLGDIFLYPVFDPARRVPSQVAKPKAAAKPKAVKPKAEKVRSCSPGLARRRALHLPDVARGGARVFDVHVLAGTQAKAPVKPKAEKKVRAPRCAGVGWRACVSCEHPGAHLPPAGTLARWNSSLKTARLPASEKHLCRKLFASPLWS